MWQEYHRRHWDKGLEVLSVALDAQGGDRVRPYVERASATFTTVVDEENLLSRIYGFKAVPNGLLVDEDGVLRYREFGGFDIRKADTADLLDRWARGERLGPPASGDEETTRVRDHARSMKHFQEGLELYRAGRVPEAMASWREGVGISPENWVIRKQIWAVEHPDRFYDGRVDYDWQREQVEKGL